MAIKSLMDVILVTGEKVSKYSRPSSCLKSFATSLALYLSIDPSGFSFFRKTHLQPIILQPGDKSTNFHVLLEISDSISSFTASFQKIASCEDKASFKVRGSLSTLKT